MRALPALFACLYAVAPPAALSQPLYRCGNTFSQTPCALDAQASKLPAAGVPTRAAGVHGGDLCTAEGPARLGLPDPSSVRADRVVKLDSEAIQYAGQPIVARKYRVTVSVPNMYGVYIGGPTFDCYLSEDERRVLKVERPGQQARR